ncbi:hypothetical protein SAMN05192559_11457 [Halobacillus karajensis]|nr:hypothetical protein SAMN05192559_11457 [Halobacillus karajensis]
MQFKSMRSWANMLNNTLPISRKNSRVNNLFVTSTFQQLRFGMLLRSLILGARQWLVKKHNDERQILRRDRMSEFKTKIPDLSN